MQSEYSDLQSLAQAVGAVLQERNLLLTAAESCTGGWLAQVVTSIAGSSSWFERGFVTYSNQAKSEMLGVRESTLQRYGAVSEPTVLEMAQGAINNSQAAVSVAISGIAGPGGGTEQKPIGTVCIAWSRRGGTTQVESFLFSGDRTEVRRQAVVKALQGVLHIIQEEAT